MKIVDEKDDFRRYFETLLDIVDNSYLFKYFRSVVVVNVCFHFFHQKTSKQKPFPWVAQTNAKKFEIWLN